ncbi:MAG TPA: DUF1329 domain-containing protein [Steroidobacteraceae bacterium]|nr:DUF1329 domain-containing protein [Steroidobacteraceae bacterium]
MHKHLPLAAARLSAILLACATLGAHAGVPAVEAEKLKSTLTPLGGERAGNKEHTIPAWEGGARPTAAGDGRVPAIYAEDKPLYTIDAKNVAQHADKLADGIKALINKYPDTFSLDVYPSRRSASAPQWVYDNTFKNATRATLQNAPGGGFPRGAVGGLPFPIPQSGEELMLNHLFRWQGTATTQDGSSVRFTADGKVLRVTQGTRFFQSPYYETGMTPEKFDADPIVKKYRIDTYAPPLRAGEKLVIRNHADDEKTLTWLYLTGQRRVRKLPVVCCDVPNPLSGGIQNFDEAEGFYGGTGRYDWKLVGKREMIVPYNSNMFVRATLDELAGKNNFNPKFVRWELHRVWVVEATLKPGQRHVFPTARFYLDEDGVGVLVVERYDAQGKLAKVSHTIPVVMPSLPGTVIVSDPSYDLLRGGYYAIMMNEGKGKQFLVQAPQADAVFTPEAITGEGVR